MVSPILRLLAVLVVVASASAQPTTIRVATYNLLKYPNSDSTQRNGALRTVLAAMRPDVIVDQEIETARSVSLFRDSVLDRVFDGRFEAAPFVDVSSDTEGAFFYDSTKVSYLGMEIIRTELRGIFGYRFAVRGTTDTVWIYTLHLKASDGTAESQQRVREAGLLRQHLDSVRGRQHVIVAGDFNVYNSSEPALAVLMEEEGNADARLIDPLASIGNWHANPAFAAIHTQSPRVRTFGGGVNGGMDDRFDLILVSTTLSSVIDRGTYTAFGNDGQHFNDSINRPPNLAVSQEVAQALHDGSDHLPVYADFHFGVSAAPSETAIASLRVAPNPATDVVRFELGDAAGAGILVIRRIDGVEVARIAVEQGDVIAAWSSRDVASGIYTYVFEGDHRRAAGTIVVVR
jgi:endonuclease/exonuclease/phosphatase family metal-dependent hydrolase